MSDPYLGEIRNFGFNFAPVGWLQCQGQTLPIAQNQALFALLGVTYGGNGTTNFNLPDLRGRAPIGIGQGAGLAPITQGQMAGQASVTLTTQELPSHTHVATFTPSGGGGTPTVNVTIQGTSSPATTSSPSGSYLSGSTPTTAARGGPTLNLFADASAAQTTLAPIAGVSATISGVAGGGGSVTNGPTGSNLPIPTEPPYLGSNWCIATQGIYPSRP
jgi:microcystin-dependent protein